VVEFVIWAILDGPRAKIGALPASVAPLPKGAEIVTRVAQADLNMMLLWAKRRAKRGWSVEKMRAACE
jgi:hypothetical protein